MTVEFPSWTEWLEMSRAAVMSASWIEYMIPCFFWGVSFSYLQKTFKKLYSLGVYPAVALAAAILCLIFIGWKHALVFWISQQFAYIITFTFIKPWIHYSPWGGDIYGRGKWFGFGPKDFLCPGCRVQMSIDDRFCGTCGIGPFL